jgi:feruloyl esterase
VFDVRWAFDHPAKVTDFVWRGARELTLKAKRIIAAYYGTSVRYSYWNGCSNGGGEGLMQAQRFPDEFDGIISGGAAAYWTRAATQQLYISRQLINNKVSDAQIDAVNKAVIKACDANDGVVGDGLIGDPRRCHWSPKALICTASEDPSNCLTPAQVDTVAAIYAPLRDPVSGKVLFGGAMRGSEWQWGARRYGYNTLLPASGVANYQLAFNNPAWNGSPFDLHADAAKLDAFFSERNAIDPDLKKFKQRRGKIIQYMGWDDVAFTPGWTVEYYKMVVDKTGRGHAEKSLTGVQDFYRLYMMPGVGHCGGGPGPSLTRFDLVTALETWVERGIAPERINAKNAAGTLERPICPYPQEAVYKGVGDVAKAASFDCRSR